MKYRLVPEEDWVNSQTKQFRKINNISQNILTHLSQFVPDSKIDVINSHNHIIIDISNADKNSFFSDTMSEEDFYGTMNSEEYLFSKEISANIGSSGKIAQEIDNVMAEKIISSDGE